MIYKIEDKKNTNSLDFWNDFYKKTDPIYQEKSRLYLYKNIVPFIENENSFSFVEVGCGHGFGIRYLSKKYPNASFMGTDFSLKSIVHCNEINKKEKRKNLRFEVFDVLKEDFNYIYDYIAIIETLEHFEDPIFVVNKLVNYCRKLIISVPFGEYAKDDPEHIIAGFDLDDFENYNILKNIEDKEKRFLRIMISKK